MKKIICLLMCMACLLYGNIAVSFAAEIKGNDLYAVSAVLMDAENGRVLYDKNGNNVMPMASTTKIMTCIVALENGNMEDIVTASQYAASQPEVHLGMVNGRQYRLKDLLYSLMLESHNDSAVAIAEQIAGSVQDFAGLMNQKARDIGCENTFFITPNGLDAETTTADGEVRQHSTTARDLARIMMYCIEESPKREEFLEITRTVSYSFQDVEGKSSYSCNNHNAFLNMMDGALTGKTGFTAKAGYCYVGALKKDGKTFVVALLACGWPNNKTYKWSDTRKLMQYGLTEYQYRDFTLPEEYRALDAFPILNGQTERIGDLAAVPIRVEEQEFGMLMRNGEEVTVRCEMLPYRSAPIRKGETVGKISYLVDDVVVKTDLIVTDQALKEIDLLWCAEKVWGIFTLWQTAGGS
jgi:D-alanyl-D-alanine carboxypeptidase (penicillin-binding protein 5/6)